MWLISVVQQWFYHAQLGLAFAFILAMCSFGQLVAHILTPIAYRSSRKLSEPLWNAVYFYSLAFVLMIVFNGVQVNLR